MSVQTQIDRISGNVAAALAAIAEKGVSVPSGSKSDALASLIASIEAGGGGGFKTGIVTPLENDTEGTHLNIEHGLGAIPNGYAMWLSSEVTTGARDLIFIATRYTGTQTSLLTRCEAIYSYRSSAGGKSGGYKLFENQSFGYAADSDAIIYNESGKGFSGIFANKKYFAFSVLQESSTSSYGNVVAGNTYEWIVW